MIINVLLIGFFGGILYYFKRFLLRKSLLIVLFILRYVISLYTWMKRTTDKMYRLDYKRIDEYFMDKYYLIENDKTHTIVFISTCNNSLHKHIIDFKMNKQRHLENKNKIVHCSITDSNENIIMDTTDLFRRFCYYYDKQHSLLGFFKYIDEHKREFKKNMDDINIYDYNFVIYLNDLTFTEVSYPIRDLINENKRFSDLLQSNFS